VVRRINSQCSELPSISVAYDYVREGRKEILIIRSAYKSKKSHFDGAIHQSEFLAHDSNFRCYPRFLDVPKAVACSLEAPNHKVMW